MYFTIYSAQFYKLQMKFIMLLVPHMLAGNILHNKCQQIAFNIHMDI